MISLKRDEQGKKEELYLGDTAKGETVYFSTRDVGSEISLLNNIN